MSETPLPLDRFPEAKRREIERLVAEPTPPPKWLDLGMAQIVSRAWYEWHRARGVDPRKRREKIPDELRARVLERDGLVCQLCRGEVDPTDVHLNHVLPWSRGGQNTLANLQVAHAVCNLRKGNRVPA